MQGSNDRLLADEKRVASDESRFVRFAEPLSGEDFSGASFSLISLVIGVERRARANRIYLIQIPIRCARAGRGFARTQSYFK
jgi:hypothetical protein